MNKKRKTFNNNNCTDIIEPFKKINLRVDKEVEKVDIKGNDEFSRNNMNFIMLNKQKNTLNNISKISKKMFNLDKKTQVLSNKLVKYNKKNCSNMNKVNQELENLKKENNNILEKLDIILNFVIELKNIKNINTVEDIVVNKINEDKIRSHKLEEYGFYS